MTNLSYVSVRKTFGPTVALERPQTSTSSLVSSSRCSAVGLRQDHGPAHRRRLRVRRLRRRAGEQRRHHPNPGAQAQHGHGVPELLVVPQPHGGQQRRLRSAHPQDGQRRASQARGRHARPGAVDPPGRPVPAPDLGRAGPARRPRPCPGGAPVGVAARRAAQRPRRQGAHHAPRRDPPHPDRARHQPPCSSPTTRRRRSPSPTASVSCRTAASSSSTRHARSTAIRRAPSSPASSAR